MHSVNFPYWIDDDVFLRSDAEQGILYPFKVRGIEVFEEQGVVKICFKLKNHTKLVVENIHDVVTLDAAKKIAINHINQFEIPKG